MEESIHYRTCNLCEAMCGLKITHKDGQVTSIKGDEEDPFSKGFICPKAVALQDIYLDPDRLKMPLRKTSTGWEEISWNEAFDEVERGIKAIQNKYGNDAVGIYQGNPNVHNLGAMLFSSRLFRNIKTKNRYSATSVDQLPHHFVSQMMIGHAFMLPVPDIDRTMHFLVLGANPMASNGSIMSAAGMPQRIKELQARGGKMVVVDPRKTETAQKADEHHFIKPATDVYLLAAIINEILARNPKSKLSEFYKNQDELRLLFEPFTAKLAASFTGISAQKILKIVEDFLNAETAVCYGRIGVSVQQHGTLCQWMVYLINILTGNFDQDGGMMFPLAAVDVVNSKPKGTMYSYDRWKSRVSGLREFGNELPASVMAEEMLTPGEGQIKAFICSAGNPVLSTPNGRQLENALAQLDFMVSFDIYINETSKHADLILPPATGLETAHYDLIFNNLAVRNTAKYSPALFPLKKGMKYDWQIFKALGKRFSTEKSIFQRLTDPLVNPEAMIDQGLRKGPYKLTLKKLKENPHGMDLGPLKSVLPDRIFTPDGKVDLTPSVLAEGLKKLSTETHENGPFLLIGRRHLRSNNSWMHNSRRLVKGPERCTVMINTIDAKELGITDKSRIRVSSKVGQIELTAETVDDIMPGVVSIPHGWGHDRGGTKWHIAEENPGVSINDLIDEKIYDAISGNAALNGIPVSLEKA